MIIFSSLINEPLYDHHCCEQICINMCACWDSQQLPGITVFSCEAPGEGGARAAPGSRPMVDQVLNSWKPRWTPDKGGPSSLVWEWRECRYNKKVNSALSILMDDRKHFCTFLLSSSACWHNVARKLVDSFMDWWWYRSSTSPYTVSTDTFTIQLGWVGGVGGEQESKMCRFAEGI